MILKSDELHFFNKLNRNIHKFVVIVVINANIMLLKLICIISTVG